MKIGLAVSGYPPDVDGIGDYTYWLARALSELPDAVKPMVVYARKGRHESAENVRLSSSVTMVTRRRLCIT